MRELELALPVEAVHAALDLPLAAAKALGATPSDIENVRVLKRSLDARGRGLCYRYRVEVYFKGEAMPKPREARRYPQVGDASQVLIVGAGPAGLFAALKLLERGFKPVIFERGKEVASRKLDVAKLNREQILEADSNYCFGEGGAGTFSDGKLYTRASKRGEVQEVLGLLVAHGADPVIQIEAHPHIGSDKLPQIIQHIRHTLLSHGAEIHFNTRITDFIPHKQRVAGVRDAVGKEYEGAAVILATGHSAKDIYSLFSARGWAMEAKGFALGVRVEHPQDLINNIQYRGRRSPLLPAAAYSLVTQVQERGVFSFCMCPGGVIVPAMTDYNEFVLNGMSNSMRNGKWANAGLVVSVNPGDINGFEEYGALSQLAFQHTVEQRMYAVSGTALRAPAQRMTDFVRGRVSSDLPASSYHPGTVSAPLHDLLPSFIAKRLQSAFQEFDKKMKGYFTQEALLLGLESRTSSPVRLVRDPVSLEHISLQGLYPCGEGAGYAGGIVSSALDGINVAQRIV